MFPITPRMQQVGSPPITEVKRWVAGRTFSDHRPLVDMCQAVPDYPPAPGMRQYLQKLVARPEVAMYSPDEGLKEVRAEVASWYARRYCGAPSAENICLSIGASQAFWLAMLLVAEAGDEVIVQVPAYFDHPMALDTLGIKPVFVPATADGGSDIDAIALHVTSRTRALVVVTPSNPTGRVLSVAEVEELYQCASAHNVALVLDETYNAFLPPDQEPHHLFSKPDWGKNFIHLASFGKTFAITGYRAGALIAGEELIRQALKIQDSMVVCQPRITQGALAWGCRNLDSWVAYNAERMRERHDTFRALFEGVQHPFELCASGAFFAWVRHPWTGLDSWQVARLLADQAGLICLPGDAFGPGQQRYLRLAFGNLNCEDMPAAVKRFSTICPPHG
ncbi:MAG: aminotransferase [Desulfuromonadaceae bacterium]